MTNEKKINDGGPAFPLPVEDIQCAERASSGYGGMSLRDYFAGMSLQGIRSSECQSRPLSSDEISTLSWRDADAMLAEREKNEKD